MNNNFNPFESLKQLGQLRQFQKMFGQDFFKNMPMPDMAGTNFDMPFFNGDSSEFPRVDVYEQGSEVIAALELPGLSKSTDVSLSVRPNKLYVRGQIPNIGVSNDKVLVTERHHGSFDREIDLPVSVVPDTVRASYRNGVLEVYMIKQDDHSDRPTDSIPIDFA